MKRDETVYLRHILDAVTKAESYLQDVDEVTFLKEDVARILAELSE